MFISEDYTRMNSVLCWDCNIIIILFTVQKCGTRKSAECARWGELRCCTTNFYAKITSCRQTSWHLNRLAVPLGLDSASHSILHSSPPLLPTLSQQLCISKYLICVMYLCIYLYIASQFCLYVYMISAI